MENTTVGIVGLGLVGQAIGMRLRADGWKTLGFDLSAQAADAFREAGGLVASSIAEMGRQSDCVIMAVFDSNDVVAIADADEGLLGPGHCVKALIDCSTGDPEMLQSLGVRLKLRHIDLIEAPLSGSSQQIAAGAATMLMGGDAAAIESHDALLQAIASRRIHLGPAGMGAKAKLATNLVLGLNRAALAEGMVFAQALGIAPADFLALVLATPARSAAAEVKGPMMVKQDFAPQSRIRQHLKDVDLMLAKAQEAGLPMPLSRVHAQLMRAAIAAGDGELDNAAIIRQMRRAKDA